MEKTSILSVRSLVVVLKSAQLSTMRLEKIVSHAFRHPYMGDEDENDRYFEFFHTVVNGNVTKINFASYNIESGQKNIEMLIPRVWNSKNIRMIETMGHRAIK